MCRGARPPLSLRHEVRGQGKQAGLHGLHFVCRFWVCAVCVFVVVGGVQGGLSEGRRSGRRSHSVTGLFVMLFVCTAGGRARSAVLYAIPQTSLGCGHVVGAAGITVDAGSLTLAIRLRCV